MIPTSEIWAEWLFRLLIRVHCPARPYYWLLDRLTDNNGWRPLSMRYQANDAPLFVSMGDAVFVAPLSPTPSTPRRWWKRLRWWRWKKRGITKWEPLGLIDPYEEKPL